MAMEKKNMPLGIILGWFLFGLPYAIGFNLRGVLITLALMFPVSLICYYFGLYFLPTIVGVYLGYRGVKEYNEMIEQII